MCTLRWDLIRSHTWSTWPLCSVSWPRKWWWSGPWPRYWFSHLPTWSRHVTFSVHLFYFHFVHRVFIRRICHLKSSWTQESAISISGSPPNQVSLETRSTSSTACLATRWDICANTLTFASMFFLCCSLFNQWDLSNAETLHSVFVKSKRWKLLYSSEVDDVCSGNLNMKARDL